MVYATLRMALCSIVYSNSIPSLKHLFLIKVQVHDQIFFAKKIACPAIVYAEIVVVIDQFSSVSVLE